MARHYLTLMRAFLVAFLCRQAAGFSPIGYEGLRSLETTSPSLAARALPSVQSQQLHARSTLVHSSPLFSTSRQLDSRVTGSGSRIIQWVRNRLSHISNGPWRQRIVATIMGLAIMLAPMSANARMSGGRMGGSFSSSGRSSYTPSRSFSSRNYSSRGYGYRPPRVIVTGRPHMYSYGNSAVATYSPAKTIFLFAAVLTVVSLIQNANSSALDGFSSANQSALGRGTSVVQVSVALAVPNRDHPNSVLSVLNRLSKTAQMDRRVGIQILTSQVALELSRRRSSFISADSQYRHYNNNAKARQEYEQIAIRERSKFDEETLNKFGGVDYASSPSTSDEAPGDGKATMAVVTLLMAIDGDSTKVPVFRTADDVVDGLRLIASHSKVEDCLQSVEILWTPEDRSDTLTQRDLIADYPNLRTL